MGSAASTLLREVEHATPDQLRAAVSTLSAEERARVSAAVVQLHEVDEGKSREVIAAAGENEDGVDEALAAELAEQEKMFLKCLRKRAEREARRKLEKEERKAAAKKLKDKAMEAAFDNELDDLLKPEHCHSTSFGVACKTRAAVLHRQVVVFHIRGPGSCDAANTLDVDTQV